MPAISSNAAFTTVQQEDSANDIWCYCKQPTDDRAMIGCDYPDCLIQWFHIDCLKLSASKIPKENWYCPDCRKKFKGRHPPGANIL